MSPDDLVLRHALPDNSGWERLILRGHVPGSGNRVPLAVLGSRAVIDKRELTDLAKHAGHALRSPRAAARVEP
jgi:hypothetical protein